MRSSIRLVKKRYVQYLFLNYNITVILLKLINVGFQKVMDYKELCQILGIPEEEPQMEPPSPTGQPSDIHGFLASPSNTNKR